MAIGMNNRYNLDLIKIEERRKTFSNWTKKEISIDDLTEAGFFFTGMGPNDQVECFSCGLALGEWEEGDDPLKEHRSAMPKCPYLLNLSANSPRPPAYPDNATINARLNTFVSWTSPNQIPFILVEAGFFYTGEGDICKCYYCGVGLDDWRITDLPWEAHAYYSADCDFVRFMKPSSSVDNIARDQMNNDEKDVSEEDLCPVCYTHESSIVLVPCGHVFCSRCSLSVQDCPTCREDIDERIKFIM